MQEISKISSDLNNLIQEVANASSEQSIGLQEINRAMQELDESSHENSSLVEKVSSLSSNLKKESSDLNHITLQMMELFGSTTVVKSNSQSFEGEETKATHTVDKDYKSDNILPLKSVESPVPTEHSTTVSKGLKVAGSDIEIPSEFDDRFEDL